MHQGAPLCHKLNSKPSKSYTPKPAKPSLNLKALKNPKSASPLPNPKSLNPDLQNSKP